MLSKSPYKLTMVFACLLSTSTLPGTVRAQTQTPETPLQAWQPARTPSGEIPRMYDKQGYPKDKSAEMLDPQVRQLLDAALSLYREPGLFTNRKKALEVLGVQGTTRQWSLQDQVPGGHRSYIDTFSKSGIFARPAWSGTYAYNGKDYRLLDTWHAIIRIDIDNKRECHNSRAVEGYLDLVLDPGIRGFAHSVSHRLQRHEVSYAEPYAPSFTPLTPLFGLTFSKGCLAGLLFAEIFNFKDINDDNAHDQ